MSCDLKIEEFEEAAMGSILYFTMGLAAFAGGPLSNR